MSQMQPLQNISNRIIAPRNVNKGIEVFLQKISPKIMLEKAKQIIHLTKSNSID